LITLFIGDTRVEFKFSQCLLAFEHVHVGHRLFPVNAPLPPHELFLMINVPLMCSAHPYGRPTILSSYSNFYDSEVGSPNNGVTLVPRSSSSAHTDSPGSRPGKLLRHYQRKEMVSINSLAHTRSAITIIHRLCQHRWPAITGMVGFQNNVGSAPLTGWVSPSSQQIAFSRGTYQCLFISSLRKSSCDRVQRFSRLCSHQQRGWSMGHDILNRLAYGFVLQRHRGFAQGGNL
jgi:hypothetical protein